jgi:hypothetical protein
MLADCLPVCLLICVEKGEITVSELRKLLLPLSRHSVRNKEGKTVMESGEHLRLHNPEGNAVV